MKRKTLLYVLAALIGAIIGGAVVERFPALRLTPSASARQPVAELTKLSPRTESANPAIIRRTPEEEANIYVYEQANRSVVNINTLSVRRNEFLMLNQQAKGSGSGSVLDKRGHLLTNFHVVDGAQEIEVTLASGNTYPATLIGKDKTDDIAILKINAPEDELEPIVWGDSSNLKVGQRAYAIGNPFGWERTLTTGIVSSLNRTLPSRRQHHYMKALIQTDAAMNPGNSGGPLLDSNARVIGMNVAIASNSGQNSGVGFAIPANRIQRMINELIEHGKITRADIGVETVGETPRGLVVVKVTPNGPAEQAGLQGFKLVVRRFQQGGAIYEQRSVDRSSADLIVGINGEPVRTVEQFLERVEANKPGDSVTLSVVRQGEVVELPVTLGAS